MQFSTMAGTAVGMAVGAAAVCLATQDQRMMRKTVHKLAKGAEKTLADLDWLLRCHEAVRLTGLSASALLKAADLHATLMNEDWQHVGSALIATTP